MDNGKISEYFTYQLQNEYGFIMMGSAILMNECEKITIQFTFTKKSVNLIITKNKDSSFIYPINNGIEIDECKESFKKMIEEKKDWFGKCKK